MLEFTVMAQIDYLLIGHITRDLTPEGDVVGGTAAYSGRIGQALGLKTAVLTSCQPDYPGLQELADLDAVVVPAEATTTFENIYTPDGRQQTIYSVANRITNQDVPEAWKKAKIVHLAPVADEVDPEIMRQFPDSLIGMTPQGWMRQWDENGRISPKEWPGAEKYFGLADIVIVSQEDLLSTDMLFQYWAWSNILVLTGGIKGCIVFYGDKAQYVPTIPVAEVDATGAGDTFATAFMFWYDKTGDPVESARFANTMASHSVTRSGIENVIKKLKKKLKEWN
ncbi:MAG TPA: hypothetical protein EYP41_03270 [Anaerolineae bacterium]|nr:hypothetical protein [Anaerolineae bacterium]HIP72204.1 hypothetical protein [Anaerolineae bacterium]